MIIRPEAEADLADARAYYESRRAGLGDEFLRAVRAALVRIESTPELHAVVHRDVRRTLIRRFPFAVYYRIHLGEPVVLAVVHGSRDPGRWKSRS